jgi:hypothetical protein
MMLPTARPISKGLAGKSQFPSQCQCLAYGPGKMFRLPNEVKASSPGKSNVCFNSINDTTNCWKMDYGNPELNSLPAQGLHEW